MQPAARAQLCNVLEMTPIESNESNKARKCLQCNAALIQASCLQLFWRPTRTGYQSE